MCVLKIIVALLYVDVDNPSTLDWSTCLGGETYTHCDHYSEILTAAYPAYKLYLETKFLLL